MKRVMEIALKIASKGKSAIKNIKEVTLQGYNMDFDAGCELEANIFSYCFGKDESKEGMHAFLEKRKPNR